MAHAIGLDANYMDISVWGGNRGIIVDRLGGVGSAQSPSCEGPPDVGEPWRVQSEADGRLGDGGIVPRLKFVLRKVRRIVHRVPSFVCAHVSRMSLWLRMVQSLRQ